jgi:hypothetical protein
LGKVKPKEALIDLSLGRVRHSPPDFCCQPDSEAPDYPEDDAKRMGYQPVFLRAKNDLILIPDLDYGIRVSQPLPIQAIVKP